MLLWLSGGEIKLRVCTHRRLARNFESCKPSTIVVMKTVSQQEPHQFINFSGGRSSGYMLYLILQENGGEVPPNSTVIFSNTGQEWEETLRFVNNVSNIWGVDITWLEYRYRPERKGGRADPKNWFEVVDFESASRNAEPFDMLIDQRNYLPNVATRICSMELKVNIVKKYARVQGIKDYVQVLGIRYDEPRRWSKILKRDDKPRIPLFERKVTRRDVAEFWERQNFDLEIPSEMGNCKLCFLKSRRNIVQTIQLIPDVATWWIEKEERVKKVRHRAKPENAQFNKKISYAELRDIAMTTPDLFNVVDVETGKDCMCGD